MVNPINVGNILLENLKQEFGEVPKSPRSEEEDDLAKQLLCTIKNAVSEVTVKIEHEYDEDELDKTQDDLDFNPFADDHADSDQDETEEQDSDENESSNEDENIATKKSKDPDPDYDFVEEKSQPTQYTMDYMRRAVEHFDRYGWKTVTHNFTKVKTRQQIGRFRKLLANSGPKYEKFRIVKERVLEKYKEAIAEGQKVQDKDLQSWGLEICKELGYTGFKISNTWLRDFKKANNISFKDKKSDDETRIARKAVLKKYNEVKATGQKITEKDLQKWAQEFCDKMGFDKKIGIGWVYSFKQVNNIWLKGKKSEQISKSVKVTSEDGSTFTATATAAKRKKKKQSDKSDLTTDKSAPLEDKNICASTTVKEISSSAAKVSKRSNIPVTTQCSIIPVETQIHVPQKPDDQSRLPIVTDYTTCSQGQSSEYGLVELISSYPSGGVPTSVSEDAWSQLLYHVEDPRVYNIPQSQHNLSYQPQVQSSSHMMPLNFQTSTRSAQNFPHGPC